MFNAAWNPICAITGLDDGRIKLAGAVEGLLRPAMEPIVATVKALGHVLPGGVIDSMVHVDPTELHSRPSMLCDVEKVVLRRFLGSQRPTQCNGKLRSGGV